MELQAWLHLGAIKKSLEISLSLSLGSVFIFVFILSQDHLE